MTQSDLSWLNNRCFFFSFMVTAFYGGCEVATVGISHCKTIGKDAGLTFVHFQA